MRQFDAGADATVVARWVAEVQGKRLRAELDLGTTVTGEKMTKDQVRTLVLTLHDIASVLATTDPRFKAEVTQSWVSVLPTTMNGV